ncbi:MULTISPECIES: NADPH-dependent 7-cyano-7-deazaguanine reductase QueF [Erwinia]|uniref:NADPH-dependent 7-cyano-7-deazaguanine reductase n=2 Tax=Erwinia TaxID=551 RepID=A0A014NJZ7_9GAMM|nr:NADPH-dependent 7-cyano-7-deazaguanine reductase QueF [Erwinia mallotivora]EXU74120.1 NADPH-dependent 7-cyano-7-deazaguanine reductase [Erwinia mallotivora]
MNPENITLLGTKTEYIQHYTPSILEAIPRSLNREEIGIKDNAPLPFSGTDLWTAWEISWLNDKGKPVVAIGEFFIPASSPDLIESKSFKLYLNSFNQSRFPDAEHVSALMKKDLSDVAGAPVELKLYTDINSYNNHITNLPGESLDGLDIAIENYEFDASLLKGSTSPSGEIVSETLHSDLLKSNCLVTNQPDWGSVIIRYEGSKIDREKLLRYIISFRNHNEFHEQCVERIYSDIMLYCQPAKLTVFARYTRRGGLDINPFRSNCEQNLLSARLVRQ